ncbi:MAG: hypothetical protein COB04_06560 [Gammaproteobacteria bacterium]|nr:MAG: hypothetical protein COB04_06560 [Gammaproteobacteria bacterium]
MTSILKKIILRLLAALTLSLVFGGAYSWHLLNSPTGLSQKPALISVVPGMGLSSIAKKLAKSGIIDNGLVFSSYVRLLNKGGRIKAGEYQFNVGQNELEVLDQLITGQVVQHEFTFVEGWDFAQTLSHLNKNPAIKHTLGQELDDRDQWFEHVMRAVGYAGQNPEGLFYPETYYFTRGMTDVHLLQRAYLQMQKVLREEWELRAPELPYDSPYEALIMASMVEKETGLASERERIAGVFVRRLRKGMRLQTDPTVIYGLGKQYSGNLTRKHLKAYTPYNTYRIKAMPPTPIANSGRAAIHAALHPLAGNSLYFVARGDGGHYFSATFDEHKKAVKKYQWNRADNYHSSPQ